MELVESAMWVALGFGPTLAALAGASKAKLLRGAARAGKSRAREGLLLHVR